MLGSGKVWPLTLPLPKWLAILFLSLPFVLSVVADIEVLQLGTFGVSVCLELIFQGTLVCRELVPLPVALVQCS